MPPIHHPSPCLPVATPNTAVRGPSKGPPIMRHPLLLLHLLELQLTDQLQQALEAKEKNPERGSVTIEQVAWAAAVIAIVAIAVAGIRAYVAAQVGRL